MQYSADSLQGDDILLFERKTYGVLVSFWPTGAAAEEFLDVVFGMNLAEKNRVLQEAGHTGDDTVVARRADARYLSLEERAMRTLVTEFISLDGVVQAPGSPTEDTDGGFRHGGWSIKYFDPEVMGRTFDELARKSEALLQGRRTYQVSAETWPHRSGDGFSDWINGVQKYVVSDTLSDADITWKPTTIIRGADLVRTVSELRDKPGGYIYTYGSATMVRALLAADLVDVLLLTIEPILLGGGKTIFPHNGEALPFELVSIEKASTGAHVCLYQRAHC